jgi:hypothetical protein
MAGDITSSIAYKREKEGIAIINKIIAGVTVQTISIKVPCVRVEEIGLQLFSKCHNVLANIQETKTDITTIKNIKS